ncbi:hypothetical protein PoB_000590200 [Plakobranchus ocellatus]|uniref:Uncharacterized protein n=1 Tax=Plakobranchus ocellatus TaxID=259542 RepID=A0AAV3Y9C8_9GAST|nr:hypothetical protein PoB_000590200 [Plakobranchus ocellatus]
MIRKDACQGQRLSYVTLNHCCDWHQSLPYRCPHGTGQSTKIISFYCSWCGKITMVNQRLVWCAELTDGHGRPAVLLVFTVDVVLVVAKNYCDSGFTGF